MIIKNLSIITADQTINNGYVKIEEGIIKEVGANYQGEGLDMEGKYLLPGFIDFHTHGCFGADTMDATQEALDIFSSKVVEDGITSILPTTLTMDIEKIKEALRNVASYQEKPQHARIIGVHLEGPFINVKYKGAQNEKYIIEPSIKMFEDLNAEANDKIKIISYAVEKADVEFTTYLKEKGIVSSVGHSGASFSQVEAHYLNGLNSITHYHNGQSPHHHRTPGVVSAGLYFDNLNTEIIVDGVHLHKDTVRLTYKVKGRDHVLLITDSMRAKLLPNGNYDLGGLECVKNDTEVRTLSGSLAGSILKMTDAIKNMISFTGCSLNDITVMTSLNQAKLLKLDDRLGKIEEGYVADLVVLDQDLEVALTVCNGLIAYKND